MISSFDATDGLGGFELPKALVGPALRAFRLGNTALDMLFYDACALTSELMWRGDTITTTDTDSAKPMPGHPFVPLDLGAMSNPEGCLLIVDPTTAPYVTSVPRVDTFIASPAAGGDLAVAITGVGSSALGSAAFAWNAAVALGHPVVSIVPGYGVADALYQGLGGWFGFGLHGWLAEHMQATLAAVAPGVARVGHDLIASIPGHPIGRGEAPRYETGSAASDVLHALLRQVKGIKVVVGHSKGALAIENALRSLPTEDTQDLAVVTLGCPIDESVAAATYVQILGAFDGLGQLNAWGHHANVSIPTHHSTNTLIPFSMPVAALVQAAVSGELSTVMKAGRASLQPPSAVPLLAIEAPASAIELLHTVD